MNRTTTKKGSISGSFVAEALAEAERRGSDASALLVRAGLPPDLLGRPQARIAPQQYGALWHLLVAQWGDEFFGMDSHPMRPGSFSMLCHALLDCADLGQALQRMLRFFALVLDDVEGSLECSEQGACLVLNDRKANGRLFAHGTLFVMMYGLACWLVGRRLSILETSFLHPLPAHASEYRLIFGDTVRFGQVRSALVLDAADLVLPVVRDAQAAREFLRQAPAIFLVKFRNRQGPVAQVRARLQGLDPLEWPAFAALAESMHTTASTLRRRLEKEGSSYQSIKDDLRHDMALHYLDQPGMNVVDIGYALGFSDPSAFHRAFRKWTGASPGEFRSTSAQAPQVV
ncbi:MAG: AraC family transcriptional regulator [Rhodoferax sp.]